MGRVGDNGRLGLVVIGRNLNVLRHVHQHRAGAAGDSQPECFPDGVRQVPDLPYKVIVLGNGQGDAGDVDLLEGVGADLRIHHIAGNGHHGNGIQESGGNASDQIGGSRAGGGDDHTGLPSGPGPAVGSVGSALLMGGEHVGHLVPVLVESVVDVDHLPAGVAENSMDALLQQGSDNNVRAGQFQTASSFLR